MKTAAEGAMSAATNTVRTGFDAIRDRLPGR
jgi:hypothetical protein